MDLFPYRLTAAAIIGSGIIAANVSFQLMRSPIVKNIVSIYIVESTSVKTPKPVVILTACRSFVPAPLNRPFCISRKTAVTFEEAFPSVLIGESSP